VDLTGWTPAYAQVAAGELTLEWCYTGQRRFTEPFFGDTIDRVSRDLAALVFRQQTTFDVARDWHERGAGMAPAGLIFHMSRCGSTLVAQMLAALPENRVLSEPTPLNAIVRAALLDQQIPRARVVEWLRTVIGLLGRPLEGERRYFLKLDCWHVLALPLLLEAFPAAPWIFLYREPAAVLVAQVREPGAWTVASALEPEVFAAGREPISPLPRPDYLGRALARLCDAALEHRGCGRGLLVNYDQLPDFVTARLLEHFGLRPGPTQLQTMRAVAGADAKTPQLRFATDRDAKRQAVTPALQAVVDRWLVAPYQRLEAARNGD
jgi:hypothetical protein